MDTKSPPRVLAMALILIAPDIALNGWVLSLVWRWFIDPVVGFDLTFAQAVGLVLFRLASFPKKEKALETPRQVIIMVANQWFDRFVVLGIGFVGHWLIS